MKPFLILVFTLLGLGSTSAQPQDYTYYNEQIIKIEESAAGADFKKCLSLYNELFRRYEIVFARDAYNACQFAALENSSSFDSLFYRCAQSGVGKNLLLGNKRIADRYKTKPAFYDSLVAKGSMLYTSRIDTSLRNEFIRRYQKEQQHKSRPGYQAICTDNFNRIVELAGQNRFPGESLIGVNEYLENDYVFATLLHYPYSYSRLKEELWQSVNTGGTQPLSVLYLYGFNQKRVSVLYTSSIPTDTVNYKACYNLPFGKMAPTVAEADRNRQEKHVASVETHRKLEAVARKYLLDYKFGY